jgi:hypothetical protein
VLGLAVIDKLGLSLEEEKGDVAWTQTDGQGAWTIAGRVAAWTGAP